jgi:hypothetical protein
MTDYELQGVLADLNQLRMIPGRDRAKVKARAVEGLRERGGSYRWGDQVYVIDPKTGGVKRTLSV